MNRKTISIIISAYNEEENIEKLYEELQKIIPDLNLEKIELIFVNDGSHDQTYQKCLNLQKKDKNIIIINLKRNFGHEIAMTAGMEHAKGEAIIFMDADLQHPPKYISEMIKEWQNGTNLILTKRIDNIATSKIYKLCASTFYKIINLFSDTKMPEKMPDFRLLDRQYVDFFKKFHEHDRLFRGLLNLMDSLNDVKIIEFVAPERFAGKTKYNFKKSLSLAIDALLQFSTKPLRISIYLGIFTAFSAICLGIYIIFEYFYHNKPATGYSSIMVAITMLSAVQLIILGIIGEYIGKIHIEVKKRPLYFAEIIDGEKNDTTKNHN